MVRFGLSTRVLDIVNSYRSELTWMIDVDNWYTIPDPAAEDRVALQRWYRDPWDKHIVKVFMYFSDVDQEPARSSTSAAAPRAGERRVE